MKEKLIHYSEAIISTFEMTLRENVVDSFIIFTVLVQPLIVALLAMLVYRGQVEEQAIYIIVGSGLTGLWSSLLFITGNSIVWERWSGTLELLVGQPTPFPIIIFGKNLAQVCQSLISMIVAYLLATWFFGYQLTIDKPLFFILSLVISIFAFVCFGLTLSSFFVINPAIQGCRNAMEFPVYILSGFLFPIALLPEWTTPLSYILAPYWAARALHGSTSASVSERDILFSLGVLSAISILSLVISIGLFNKLLYKAREDATLGYE